MRVDTWAESHIGLVRKTNQDAVGCFPEAHLFIVADGMGGRAEGGVASALAVDTLRAQLVPMAAGGARPTRWWSLRSLGPAAPAPLEAPLQRAIEAANERIYIAGLEHLSADSSLRGSMGTTVVTLCFDSEQRRAHWAHVGDSRLYRVRDHRVALLTADHTMPGEPYWGQPDIPLELPHTNRLVRALGIAPAVQVTTGVDGLQAGDLYLLCSDGVSGMIPPDALRSALLSGDAIDVMGGSLIRRALDGGGRDNASALLVHVHED